MNAMQAELFDADEFLVRAEPLSDAAKAELDRATDEYRQLLELESLIESRVRGYERVHAPHVRAAQVALGLGEIAEPEEEEEAEPSDCGIAMVVGGTLFGAGASSVVSVVTMEPAPWPLLLGCIVAMLAGVATSAYALGLGRGREAS